MGTDLYLERPRRKRPPSSRCLCRPGVLTGFLTAASGGPGRHTPPLCLSLSQRAGQEEGRAGEARHGCRAGKHRFPGVLSQRVMITVILSCTQSEPASAAAVRVAAWVWVRLPLRAVLGSGWSHAHRQAPRLLPRESLIPPYLKLSQDWCQLPHHQ